VKENRASVRETITNVNAITGDSKTADRLAKILENIKQVTRTTCGA
jgi:hypothetical protein